MKKLIIYAFLSLLLIGCNNLTIADKLKVDGWQENIDKNQVLSNKINNVEYHLDLVNNLFYYDESEYVKYEVDYNKGIVTRLLNGSNYVTFDDNTKTLITHNSFEDINEYLIKGETGDFWFSCKYDYINHEFLEYVAGEKYTCIETGSVGAENAYDLFKDMILDKYHCTIKELISEYK